MIELPFNTVILTGSINFLFLIFFMVTSICSGSTVWADTLEEIPSGSSKAFDSGPDVDVSLEMNLFYRDINAQSALNPDNELLDMDSRGSSYELKVKLADYIDPNNEWRWLARTYCSQSSEKNEVDSLRSVVQMDELFIDYSKGPGFLSIGKRRVSWGHALAFNPVNVIVPSRDPMDPRQETEGHPVLWSHLGTNQTYIDLILTRNYDKNWSSDDNRWGTRLGFIGSSYDLSLYYSDGAFGSNETLFPRMIAGSFSTNLVSGMTLYGEVASFSNNFRNYYDASGGSFQKKGHYEEGVLGSYIILDPESILSFFQGDANLTVEYFFNGQGYSKNEREHYYDALKVSENMNFFQMLKDYMYTGMARHYFLLSYQNSFKERWQITVKVLSSEDASFGTVLEGQYNISDYYTIQSCWSLMSGDRYSEFGNSPTEQLFEIIVKIDI